MGGCETDKPEDSSENAPAEQELNLATLLSFGVTTRPCPSPVGQEKAWVPSSGALVTKARPWGEAVGLSSSFPRGQETSANTHGLLVGMAAKWSLWWQLTYLMETHTLPAADSPKGLKALEFPLSACPPGGVASKPRSSLGTYLWHMEEVSGKSGTSASCPSQLGAKGVIRCILLPETTPSVSPKLCPRGGCLVHFSGCIYIYLPK